MTTFIIIAALLVVATVALLFLPLFRGGEKKEATDAAELSMQVLREQMQDIDRAQAAGQMDAATAEKEKRELERRALEENALNEESAAEEKQVAATVAGQRKLYIVAAVVAVPLLAGGLYWLLGTPSAVAPGQGGMPADHAAGGNHSLSPQQIMAMTEKLAEKLAANPNDGEGWLMLGRSYAMIGRHGESAAAFGRAISILPPNAGLYADYADVLAMAQGRRLAGEPEKAIAKSLELDPGNVKGLALSGSAAFERGDYRRAVSEWQKILLLVPPDSNVAQSIKSSIADAQARAGDMPGAPAAQAAMPGASVSGSVSLDAKLKDQVAPTDTVFVFARAVDGPRMPLAMKRMTVAQLPTEFSLDDSMSMTPNARLSGVKQVIIGARVSKAGGATPRPGDLEGFSQPVAVGSKKVAIVIDTPVR